MSARLLSGVARRALAASVTLGVLGTVAACANGQAEVGGPLGPPPAPRNYLLGGDISALTRLEQAGATYRVGDVTVSAIAALRANGANLFRLRLFLAPNGQEVQVNDLAYTIALAKRVKASGAQLLLDFHYSDTWADPGNQVTPAAWSGLSIDALEARVEAYTAAVLDTMRAEGVLPRIVQVGNEIDAGMLWPVGRIGGPSDDDSTSYADFARLLKAGVRGVRAATTAADSVRVMLHVSSGADQARTQWFFDLVGARGVTYDLIGLSYYPWWHGSIQQLRDNLAATAQRYGKDVMVVETAYPWRDDWAPSGTVANPFPWPRTPQGQRQFVAEVVAAVGAVPNQRGIGVVWWYPEAVQVTGLFVWGGGSLALFDANGRLLPAGQQFGQVALRNDAP